ncbi:hypothetical protein ANTQUA_LOCUS3084 [Anthophora quadrimaculata]
MLGLPERAGVPRYVFACARCGGVDEGWRAVEKPRGGGRGGGGGRGRRATGETQIEGEREKARVRVREDRNTWRPVLY